jgi:hypothetical protein
MTAENEVIDVKNKIVNVEPYSNLTTVKKKNSSLKVMGTFRHDQTENFDNDIYAFTTAL